MNLNVFLVGLMGSGKSFWAGKVSIALSVSAFDLDEEIEKREGKTILSIFTENGEDYFREKESEALYKFNNINSFILATGGGTPCFHNNMDWMNAHGITIWIDEPLQLIAHRLLPEKAHRPLIKNIPDNELLSFLTLKREKRKPYYSKAKHHLYQSNLTENHFLEILSNE